MVKVSAEIVNGECPTCSEITMLVSLSPELYESKKEAILDNFNRVLSYFNVEDWMHKEYFANE